MNIRGEASFPLAANFRRRDRKEGFEPASGTAQAVRPMSPAVRRAGEG